MGQMYDDLFGKDEEPDIGVKPTDRICNKCFCVKPTNGECCDG